MNELTNNGTHRNISLNVNPYITMTPIINHLLKYVEVVVKDKGKIYIYISIKLIRN